MFGNSPMYGQAIATTDKKTRISLPKFTKAEVDDELLALKDEKGIRVIAQKELDQQVEYLENLYNNEIDEKKRVQIGRILYDIYSSILKSCTCDGNRRILLSQILNPTTKYRIIGCRKYILIQDETLDESQLNLQLTDKSTNPNL